MERVRQATPDDAAGVARVDVETWRSAYAGVLPAALLVALSERRRREIWTAYVRQRPGDLLVVADEREAVLGFGNCGLRREQGTPFAGEVFTLYVLPEAQGRGLGRDLLLGLFGRLLSRGIGSAIVWVLRDNPARYFYERCGGRLVSHRPMRVTGAVVPAVAYGWTDLDTVVRARARLGGRAEY